jgi:hypothetical protein
LSQSRAKKDNRWGDVDGGSAFVISYTLLRHPNFMRLTSYGHKLIHDLGRQFTGFNNGYLCASFSLMEEQGWSKETLWRTVRELEHYKLILRTQQGGKHKPNLHAFTWCRIDEKKDKPLEVGPTAKPGHEWKIEQPEFDTKIVHLKRRKKRLLRAA